MWLHLTLMQIQSLIGTYGYAFIALIAIPEGPIVGAIAGIFVATGQFNWFLVFLALLIGDVVGDIAYYAIGRYGHGPFVKRIAAWLGLSEEKMRPLEEGFKKNDVKLLLIGKTQALGSVILYFAGAVRMPLWRFIWWNTVGSIPKVILFEMVGYFFGASLAATNTYIGYAGIATFILALLLLGSYFSFKNYLGKQLTQNGTKD